MGFSQDISSLDNLPVSEKVVRLESESSFFQNILSDNSQQMISSGPIIVYKTPSCKLEHFRDRFEIIHGWSPLLLATAQCFTRLVLYQMEEPVCAPIIYKLTVNCACVQIYTHSPSMPSIREAEDCTIIENQISAEESPDFSTAIANIFMADMKSFGETVELRANTDLTIFNEKIDLIVLKPGSTVTINQIVSTNS